MPLLGLCQCSGEGGPPCELRPHPARDPGPAEGTSELPAFLPPGEDEGDRGLHLCHPHRPPRGLRVLVRAQLARRADLALKNPCPPKTQPHFRPNLLEFLRSSSY